LPFQVVEILHFVQDDKKLLALSSFLVPKLLLGNEKYKGLGEGF
jgi:hypothetical protein